MKKFVALCLTFVLGVTLCGSVFAAEPETVVVSQQIEQISEDEYVVITTTESIISTRGSVYTKTATRDYKYYLSGTRQWTFSVAGTFSIDSGVSSTCIDDAYAFTIQSGSWTLSSAKSYHSGNTATATGTVTGRTTTSPAVSITCDKDGNLS